jgi:hypothetical protein
MMKKGKALTKLEKDYVKNPEVRAKYVKTVQRQYDYRIRRKAITMLEDLRFLAENLPEDQKVQIFNDLLVTDLMKAILNPRLAKQGANKKQLAREFRQMRGIPLLNRRVFSLSNKLIEIATESSWELLPNNIKDLFILGDSYSQKTTGVIKVGRMTGLNLETAPFV